MTPAYSGTISKLWLEDGGVYVLANIRGGGSLAQPVPGGAKTSAS